MKYLLTFALLSIILLFGCSQADEEISNRQDLSNHIGCQEGEIIDGECVVAQENNAGMFDNIPEVATYDTEFGFLARPEAGTGYPGVIMIHEWWGLNDNIKTMAKILANEGYVVLAVDLYGREVADTSERARELATNVRSSPQEAIDTMRGAVEFLRTEESITNVGSVGWCFGGQQSLQLALNENMDATVIYYGQLTDDKAELSNIEWPVLGIFGAEDTSIPVDSVRGFKAALDELDISNKIYVYESVGHAFANPTGSNYAPDEAMDAWDKTLRFLGENLKDGKMYELAESKLSWSGEKIVGNPHTGTVDIESGYLLFGEQTTGEFIIDMTTISDDDGSERLVSHLKNEDFFDVEKHPNSVFMINSITGEGNEKTITGDLTIKGVTNEISFPAVLEIGDVIHMIAEFEIDRTRWGIAYNSGSIFSDLGDRAIKDMIEYKVNLVFE